MATYNVRIFGHRGLTRLQTDNGQQGGVDSVLALQQPYVWGQSLTVTVGGAAVLSSVGAPANPVLSQDPTTLLRIEVADGQTIGYEVNEGNRNVTATAASPRLSGKDVIQFGPTWRLSVIDMTGIA